MPTSAGITRKDADGAETTSREGDDDDSLSHGGTRGEGGFGQGVAVGVEYAFPGGTQPAIYAPPVSVEGRYVLASAHVVDPAISLKGTFKDEEGEGSRDGDQGQEEWDSEEEWEEAENYEQWLRRVTSRLGDHKPATAGEQAKEQSVPSTEVDLQLGALTLNRRRLQPLPPHLSHHPHFTALFSPSGKVQRGVGNLSSVATNFQVVEVDLRENCHWLSLVGRRHDLHYWSPHSTPTPIAAALTLASRSGDSGKRRRWKGGKGPSIASGERWVAGVLLPLLEKLQLGELAEGLTLPPLPPSDEKSRSFSDFGGLGGNGNTLVFGKHEESPGAVEMMVDGVSGAASAAASRVGGVVREAAAKVSKGMETIKEKTRRRKTSEDKAREEKAKIQSQSSQMEWFQTTVPGEEQGHQSNSSEARTSCVVLQGEWQGGLKEIVVMELGKMGMEIEGDQGAAVAVVQIFEVEEHGR
jgi:hypothetical protein